MQNDFVMIWTYFISVVNIICKKAFLEYNKIIMLIIRFMLNMT